MNKIGFHQCLRCIVYSLVGLLIALLFAAGCGAVWLWGWTWKGSPAFNESWTAEERAAISGFDVYLRQQYAKDISELMVAIERAFQQAWGGEPVCPGLSDRLVSAYAARMVAAPVSEMLHRFAESGDASSADSISFLDIHGLTPAIVASQTGHLRALEALVQHGADPNAIAYSKPDGNTASLEVETPISPLLNNRFINGRRFPWETRRRTAEFLLAHGGDLNSSHRINRLSCNMALIFRTPESTAPWEWALNHGMRMNPENLNLIIGFAEGRPVLERVLGGELVNVNDVSGSRTVLQSLLIPLLRLYDEEEWSNNDSVKVMEEYLDMLLAAGADPNLVPMAAQPQRPGESDEQYGERINNSDALKDTPLDIVTRALEHAELPAHRELCLRIIDKLKLAGAKTRVK